MSVTQPIITPENIIELTDYINSYRSRHQVPPLSWDPIIATYSQQWAFTMTSTHTFKHSGSALYGENISYFIGYGTDIMKLMKLAIDDWYNEMIKDGIISVIKASNEIGLDMWTYMSEYSAPANQGFMFSDDVKISIIRQKMEIGHSGTSYGWTMRYLERLAKYGPPIKET